MKWKVKTIGDLVKEKSILDIQDGNHGEKHPTTHDYVDEGIPFIMANDINDGIIDKKNCHFITEDRARRLRIGFSQEGDVLLTHKGTIGNVALVREAEPFIMLTPQVTYYRTDSERLLNNYLVYAFREPMFQLRMKSVSAQSTRPYIGITAQRNLSIIYPPITIQHKISSILSSYDELIENNLRRIEILEESARLLYREWFVHLRFPGHEHTKITKGVLEGWGKENVGSLLSKIKRKKKVKREEYFEEGKIPCVDQSQKFIGGFTDNKYTLHKEPLPVIVFGDHTRILKFIDFPFASGADGTQLIYPNDDNNISPEFFYFALKSIDLSNYFYARHFKFLKEQEVLIPEDKIVRNFTEIIKPNMKQISILREQNQALRKARDILLPHLMNGVIAV